MQTACVTGAAGFIGFHLCRRQLALGWSVTGIDNLSSYYDVKLKSDRLQQLTRSSRFRFREVDVREQNAVHGVYSREHFDCTVHLAAQPGVRYSLQNPRAYTENNVAGFLNVLEVCRLFSIKHLVYASSSSVYGCNAEVPFSVRDNVDHPVSLYAATKRANELMAHVYSHLYGLRTTGLRFFTVYGPWGRPDMAPFIFTKSILEGTPIQIFNHGDLKRDFTYIDDIIEGVIAVMERIPLGQDDQRASLGPDRSWAPYRLFNIGNNQPENLLYLIELIERFTGLNATRLCMPMQPGDVPITYADVTELVDATGFRPRTSLEDGVREFVRWYREYYAV